MSNVQLPIINTAGKSSGSFEAPSDLFSIEPNEAAVQQVCNGQRLRYYKKTATAKGRSEVSGGGKKSRQQKGSGRARQGGNRGPQFVGGGVVFGPQNITGKYKINKKLRRLALASVLSDRFASGQVHVLKDDLGEFKTKKIVSLLDSLKLSDARVGFVLAQKSSTELARSLRNIHKADLLTEEKWTPLDFVKADTLILEESAAKALVETFEKGANE